MRTYADAIVARRLGVQSVLRGAGLVLAASGLIALGAKVQVPLGVVPVTFQTVAVLLIGAMLGRRLGALAAGAYLLEGVAGLPVFAGPIAGPAYFAGPTAGYLLAFPIAAWIVGSLAERGWDRRLTTCLAAFAIGQAVVFLSGFAWLAMQVGAKGAFAVGIGPFLVVDLLKIALAATLLPVAWKWSGRRA